MEEWPGNIPSVASFVTTYACTAECPNCAFGCSPHESSVNRIPREDLLKYTAELAGLGTIELVTFTGGEPFLLEKDLVDATTVAAEQGVNVRCVTNGYWAKNLPEARRRLRELEEAGLTGLNLSTGDYHQQSVPLERVVYAVEAAVELNIKTVVAVERHRGADFTQEDFLKLPAIEELRNDDSGNPAPEVVGDAWASVNPWLSEEEKHVKEDLLTEDDLSELSGCSSVLESVSITPDLELAMCCGITAGCIPEMAVGNLRDERFASLYQRGLYDLVKIWLNVEGPAKILDWAENKDPSIDWQGRFAHPCELCRFLYYDPGVQQVLTEHYAEKKADILLRFCTLHSEESMPLQPEP